MSRNSRAKAQNASPLGRISLSELSSVLAGEQQPADVIAHSDAEAAAEARSLETLPLDENGGLTLGAWRLTTRGLVISPDATNTQWEQIGHFLAQMEGSIQWLIGDWMAAGERIWGRTYKQAAELFGYEEQTLRMLVSVSQRVDLLIRINNLSFAHHRLVVPRPHDEQRALLEYAAEVGLSLAQLRTAIEQFDRIDESVRVQWIDYAKSQHLDIGKLIAALNEYLHSPTLPESAPPVSRANSLFSRESLKQIRQIHKQFERARQGDERARLTVLGWVASQRDLLDELESTLKDDV